MLNHISENESVTVHPARSRFDWSCNLWLLIAVIAMLLSTGATGICADELRLATFSADVSPPLHQRACVGFIKEFTQVEDPLLAKGIVLKSAGQRYVICAIDYCGLCNDSYDMFREKIAAAADTTTSQVSVQSLHQHTAPVFDINTDRILYADDPEQLQAGITAAESAADVVATAVKNALTKLEPVTHIATGKAKVDRVASNRRVPQPDGSLLVRYSAAAGDPVLRDAPEGIIDPWLRTITFYQEERPLVRLHYYASHPQSRSGPIVTSDVPGVARERLEEDEQVPQIYFTGCGGNVAMGKYNDGSEEARAALTERMFDGMQAAVADCDGNKRQPVEQFVWRSAEVELPLRRDAEFTLQAARQIADDEQVGFSERLRKAMLAAWIERVQAGRPIEFTAWSVAEVDVVHLPGEPFVQFQLAAQQERPDRFVCIAGYGECAPWYIGEDRIYTDNGGYEQSWSFVGPCEEVMHSTIEGLLSETGR